MAIVGDADYREARMRKLFPFVLLFCPLFGQTNQMQFCDQQVSPHCITWAWPATMSSNPTQNMPPTVWIDQNGFTAWGNATINDSTGAGYVVSNIDQTFTNQDNETRGISSTVRAVRTTVDEPTQGWDQFGVAGVVVLGAMNLPSDPGFGSPYIRGQQKPFQSELYYQSPVTPYTARIGLNYLAALEQVAANVTIQTWAGLVVAQPGALGGGGHVTTGYGVWIQNLQDSNNILTSTNAAAIKIDGLNNFGRILWPGVSLYAPSSGNLTLNGNLTVTGTCTGCGGSSPIGSNGQFAYNNAGTEAGTSGMTWDGTTAHIVTQVKPGLSLESGSVSPVLQWKDSAGSPHIFWITEGFSSANDGIFGIYDAQNFATRLTINQSGNVMVNTFTDDGSGAKLQISGLVSATTGFYSTNSAFNTINLPNGGVAATTFNASASGSLVIQALNGSIESKDMVAHDTQYNSIQAASGGVYASNLSANSFIYTPGFLEFGTAAASNSPAFQFSISNRTANLLDTRDGSGNLLWRTDTSLYPATYFEGSGGMIMTGMASSQILYAGSASSGATADLISVSNFSGSAIFRVTNTGGVIVPGSTTLNSTLGVSGVATFGSAGVFNGGLSTSSSTNSTVYIGSGGNLFLRTLSGAPSCTAGAPPTGNDGFISSDPATHLIWTCDGGTAHSH